MSHVFTVIDAAVTTDRPDIELEALNVSGFLAEHVPEVHAMVGFGGGDTGMKSLWDHTKQVVLQTPNEPRLRWAALFHDVGKVKTYQKSPNGEISFTLHEIKSGWLFQKAARRMEMPESDMLTVQHLIVNLGRIEAETGNWTDSALRRLGVDVGPVIMDLLALCMADITTKREDKRRKFHRNVLDLYERLAKVYVIDTTPPALPSGLGDVLQAELGISAGRELGAIMKTLKAAVEAKELPRNGPFEVYVAHLKKGV